MCQDRRSASIPMPDTQTQTKRDRGEPRGENDPSATRKEREREEREIDSCGSFWGKWEVDRMEGCPIVQWSRSKSLHS